jgi:hypothetical protein
MPNRTEKVLRANGRSAGVRHVDQGLTRAFEEMARGDGKMKTRVHGARLLLSAGTAVTLAIGMLAVGQTAYAAGPTSVGLGTADGFAVLAGTGITNTGATTITGDVGSYATPSETGFATVVLTGTNHAGDSVTQGAKSDLVTAYNDAAGRTPSTAVAAGALGGKTLVAGVYNAGSSKFDLTGTLTLDGQNDPNSVWVFQAPSSLITAKSSSVKLIRGASSCNVFWQVTSSATLGSGSTFMGTITALTSITIASGVTVHGRALARNGDVTLISDTITTTCSTSSIASASASPGQTTTPPPTSLASAPLNNKSTPLFGLLICLAFGGLGVVAVEAQRRRSRS